MDKASRILLSILAVFLVSAAFSSPVLAIVPEVRSVVPHDVGGSIYLNVTVYHTPEITDHHVDTIRVIMGSNTTDMNIGVQPLTPQNTFSVTYDLGQVQGTPNITVEAHCIVNGWSIVDWLGTIPEYTLPVLLVALAFICLSVVLVRRAKVR
jgi:hypothetical protein